MPKIAAVATLGMLRGPKGATGQSGTQFVYGTTTTGLYQTGPSVIFRQEPREVYIESGGLKPRRTEVKTIIHQDGEARTAYVVKCGVNAFGEMYMEPYVFHWDDDGGAAAMKRAAYASVIEWAHDVWYKYYHSETNKDRIPEIKCNDLVFSVETPEGIFTSEVVQ